MAVGRRKPRRTRRPRGRGEDGRGWRHRRALQEGGKVSNVAKFLGHCMASHTVSSDDEGEFELPFHNAGDESCDEVDCKTKGERHARAFRRIHDSPLPFSHPKQVMLVPNCSISVKIIDVEQQYSTHILNPYLYSIYVHHGGFEWTIKRRYKHFQHLHQQLRLFRASLAIPLPTRRHKENRKSFYPETRQHLPRFPRKPDALIYQHQLQQRTKELEQYLKSLLEIPIYRNHHETMTFLEVSPLSFIHGLGTKGKEGMIRKRSGGHMAATGCRWFKRFICNTCSRWRKRWLIVKDTFVAYVKPKAGCISFVLLMDQSFEVTSGISSTGTHHAVLISNQSRRLLIRCWTKRKTREWVDYLTDVSMTTGKDFTQSNLYGSFVPPRPCTFCQWFVDGATYFEAVADALEMAREEIFITDWWLSPEIYLKRPVIHGETWRLDQILKRKAEEGVKIFVLLYKEVELALGINSMYSKQQLVRMHPNIKVLRHPDHVADGVLLWAHHEKIICVDQSYAFLGGLDLCYGRWDDLKHRLVDLGGVVRRMSFDTRISAHIKSFCEEVITHPRRTCSMSDLAYTQEAEETTYSSTKLTVPANASYDVKILIQQPTPTSSQMFLPACPYDQKKQSEDKDKIKYIIVPEPSRDVDGGKSHFVKKSKSRRVIQAVARLQYLRKGSHKKSIESLESTGLETLDISHEVQKTASEVALGEMGLQGKSKLWHGKDYTNFIAKDLTQLHLPFKDIVDRHTTPRMPWHDIGMFVQGAAARDVARHFIQRWNFTKFEKAKHHRRYPWLLPKSYEETENIPPLPTFLTSRMFATSCQVLRSVSKWSAGIKKMESSIHSAYVDAIQNAKHFIYIENQFFISQAAGNRNVFNEIAEALYRRIITAHGKREAFKVYIIMPLLPAFEGEIGTETGTAIQAITHWNYASICRGCESLYSRLEGEVSNPQDYISFFGLRTHGELNDKLVTELIYVHSKLMIVDDCIAIIGSANINDRSLLGDRDSEVAMIVKDEEFDRSVMNGQPFETGKFAGTLRRTLFREHLGLKTSSAVDLRDPISSYFYKNVWLETASKNSSIYEEVFHCVPTDKVCTFAELYQYQSQPSLATKSPTKAKEMLQSVKGHLVLMPLNFLNEEDLTPAAGTAESFMPLSLWT